MWRGVFYGTKTVSCRHLQPKAAVEFDQAINYVNKIKVRSRRSWIVRTCIALLRFVSALAANSLQVQGAVFLFLLVGRRYRDVYSSYLRNMHILEMQTRFANDERVYKAFLEILNMYRKGQKTITNVYEEVGQLADHLLQDHHFQFASSAVA